MRRTDALIAGGGPAGAAVALQLARAGRRPLLVDRQRERGDPVCGGFMGGDAIASLAALGIDVQALGAHPIERSRIFAGRRVAEAPLPFQAAGLSRACLDEHLLTLAAAAGAGVERGVTIRQASPERLTLDLADGASLKTDALFLATGKHELRGAARPVTMGSDPALGLRTPLAPGERYLWARTVLSRPTLGVAAVLLRAAAAQLPTGGSAVLVDVLVAAAVVSTALTAVARVRVDGDGVHVRQALLGRPLAEAPLAEVRGARSEQLDPERFGWNEYGVLRRSPSVLGYRARRAGEALVLDLTGARRFVVTVPDAATAAGLVNAELDRRAGHGATGAAPSC